MNRIVELIRRYPLGVWGMAVFLFVMSDVNPSEIQFKPTMLLALIPLAIFAGGVWFLLWMVKKTGRAKKS